MRKSSLYKSLALHGIVILMVMIDLPFFGRKDMTLDQVPIIVDLNDVKISEMTNLPSKAEFADEDSPATREKIEEQKSKDDERPQEVSPDDADDKKDAEPEEDETPKDPKQDFVVPPQPSKPEQEDKKPEPKRPTPKPQPKKPTPPKKPEPKKEEPKKQKNQPVLDNPLKDLLASVDNMEKKLGEQSANATIKHGTQVNNMGIAGGVGGSYFSDLSISEADAIAGRLRACWNLDPGAMGIEDMIIEVRAYLNQDGTVRQVDILDKGRYNRDPHFRSVADSARRAVFVCQPYNILAEKYPQKYDMWKTMLLRFNPISHTVN
ncbi:MAG: hypothetical protein J6Y53_00680 [Alphaproteobacteria bacterium]|nr:hypothetical protein [Alphaproteobacteria bacterium]